MRCSYQCQLSRDLQDISLVIQMDDRQVVVVPEEVTNSDGTCDEPHDDANRHNVLPGRVALLRCRHRTKHHERRELRRRRKKKEEKE